MKKIFLIGMLFGYSILSLSQTNNFVIFKAEIANKNTDFISIRDNKKVYKKIQINKDGFFKDTLNVKDGLYQMYDGVEVTSMYLKNGYDLSLKMDAKKFDESIVYTGVGANENNYLAQATIEDSKLDYDKIFALKEAEFNDKVDEISNANLAKLESSNLDPAFIELQKKNIEGNKLGMKQYYGEAQKKQLLNNTMSAPFDYLNFKGGNTKLSDFKGKYVYIDVWATWCGPCRAEIPFLKKTEEKYEGKNIAFVSISVDVQKDFEKWKKFVAEKQLGGVQLFADKDWNSDFMKSYSINSIPRFILIDPTGKIISADASRPSSPKLSEQLDGLLK
ncbi:MAG: TlpA family protein disulfide reductase [Flavobacterium sp.]|nr:TlpA family protein disulfide reductase [Flavobacterium sp.]